MIEGSGSGAESGSIPLTSVSGSGRPKNIWIQRTRIRNTVLLLTQVVVDLVAGHTSDQHEWFEKSVAREAGYEDYYVWRDGASSSPPTPWKSVDGGKF